MLVLWPLSDDVDTLQLALERKRAAAVWAERRGKNPNAARKLIEEDWMSDSISDIETDDEEKRKTYREELGKAACLQPREIAGGVKAWEIIKPRYRSQKYENLLREIDDVGCELKFKKGARRQTPRVFRRSYNEEPPRAAIFDFMLDRNWESRFRRDCDSGTKDSSELEILEANLGPLLEDGNEADDEGDDNAESA
ncbi:hypothetical protein K474DRAFT_1712826 [Panus rudis PR-1116 ss-1]|nr:hypothetical protein K474DRAFT_1712826 [Panus rudis PR-1116 ss-1]